MNLLYRHVVVWLSAAFLMAALCFQPTGAMAMDIFSDLIGGITGMTSGLWPQPSERPGLVEGKLRQCPGTPNCVCSEAGTASGQKVEPLAFGGSPESARVKLKQVVAALGGTIRHEEQAYLWSTFQVPVVGFTDDVEFRMDVQAGVIHVRSASRVGYSDLGVNRSRVDELRAAFEKP